MRSVYEMVNMRAIRSFDYLQLSRASHMRLNSV